MTYIEHLVEPDRLILVWQAQDSADRSRYVVGELKKSSDVVSFNYLKNTPDFDKAKQLGFRGYPAFPLDSDTGYNNQVMEAFCRRLPPRSRSDFNRFLELRGLKPDSHISDFALLGYTGAKLPNDGFELVHPFDNIEPPFELIIEIAGFRYESEIAVEMVTTGGAVEFVPEPDNNCDPNAIRIECGGKKIGYVARGRLELFHTHLNRGNAICGEIVRMNGTPQRPLVYVYVRVVPH